MDDDIIYGGVGNDQVLGDKGNDQLIGGGTGSDNFIFTEGNNIVQDFEVGIDTYNVGGQPTCPGVKLRMEHLASFDGGSMLFVGVETTALVWSECSSWISDTPPCWRGFFLPYYKRVVKRNLMNIQDIPNYLHTERLLLVSTKEGDSSLSLW